MFFITVAALRRTYGLSVLHATTIIRQGRVEADRRYRYLAWIAQPCLMGAGVSVVFRLPMPPLAQTLLWLTGLTGLCLRLYLVQHVSHAPILTAAHAAALVSVTRSGPADSSATMSPDMASASAETIDNTTENLLPQ